MTQRIRRARPVESGELTALMRRSKAHWGYPADLMTRFAEELTLTGEQIASNEVWLLEDAEGRTLGFYQVVGGEPAILEDLWVEPSAIAAGYGRLLWNHAVGRAGRMGADAIELDADPNAVGFYERMGAVTVGETPSTVVSGRSLPRMRFDLR